VEHTLIGLLKLDDSTFKRATDGDIYVAWLDVRDMTDKSLLLQESCNEISYSRHQQSHSPCQDDNALEDYSP
jgi:hypothetical protein